MCSLAENEKVLYLCLTGYLGAIKDTNRAAGTLSFRHLYTLSLSGILSLIAQGRNYKSLRIKAAMHGRLICCVAGWSLLVLWP